MSNENTVAHIYYDLRVAPTTFDAAVFFAIHVSMCRLNGYRSFDVYIVAPGYRTESDREKAYSIEQREWRASNLIAKLPLLIPGVQNVYVIRAPRIFMAEPKFPNDYDPNNPIRPPYKLNHLSRVAEAGADVQVFSASKYARLWAREKLGEGKTIVTAIRTSDFDRERDTPLDKWFKLYEHLTNKGYRVFVIPDQYDVLFGQKYKNYTWNTIPEAAVDLDLRLALYQECSANISWGGGNTSLLWLSKCPFLYFGAANSQSLLANRDAWNILKITFGEQFPFFLPHQRIDWTDVPDLTVKNLIERADAYLAETQDLRRQ